MELKESAPNSWPLSRIVNPPISKFFIAKIVKSLNCLRLHISGFTYPGSSCIYPGSRLRSGFKNPGFMANPGLRVSIIYLFLYVLNSLLLLYKA